MDQSIDQLTFCEQNSYLVQVTVKNVSVNKIFVDRLEFINSVTKDLQLTNLNTSLVDNDRESLFENSVCFA